MLGLEARWSRIVASWIVASVRVVRGRGELVHAAQTGEQAYLVHVLGQALVLVEDFLLERGKFRLRQQAAACRGLVHGAWVLCCVLQ